MPIFSSRRQRSRLYGPSPTSRRSVKTRAKGRLRRAVTKRLFDLCRHVVETTVDVGYTYTCVALVEILTYNVKGEAVKCHYEFNRASMRPIIIDATRPAAQGTRSRADEWKLGRKLFSLRSQRDLSNRRVHRHQWSNSWTVVDSRSDKRIVVISATLVDATSCSTSATTTVACQIAGVHNAAFGMPIVRRLIKRLADEGVCNWANRVDEYARRSAATCRLLETHQTISSTLRHVSRRRTRRTTRAPARSRRMLSAH